MQVWCVWDTTGDNAVIYIARAEYLVRLVAPPRCSACAPTRHSIPPGPEPGHGSGPLCNLLFL